MNISHINKAELGVMLKLHRDQVKQLEQIARDQSCRTCTKLHPGDHCATWNSKVPPEAKAVGCDRWEWDDIPF